MAVVAVVVATEEGLMLGKRQDPRTNEAGKAAAAAGLAKVPLESKGWQQDAQMLQLLMAVELVSRNFGI